jgi:hypothetical protein
MNNKEKKSQSFINIAFDESSRPCNKISQRLLKAFKGQAYNTRATKDRFTVNTLFSLVNLILPNFIFQQPYLRVKAQNSRYLKKSGDDVTQLNAIRAARNGEAVINHHYKKIGAIMEDRKALQDALFYPFGVVKNGYSFETSSMDDQDYVVKDTPFHQRINPEDFGYHPLASDPSNADLLVHRSWSTLSKLKKKDNDYSNLGDLKGELPKFLKDRYKGKKKKDLEFFSDIVPIYEVHAQDEGKIYTYAGSNHTLINKKDRGNDFAGSDFDIIKFAGPVDEFDGIPMLAMVEDEVMVLNELLTLMVEHMRKFPGQIFFEEGSLDALDLERIKSGAQGSMHMVNKLDKIERTPPLQMGGDYFAIVNLVYNIIDRVLGVPDFQRMSGSGRKSATEASFIQGDATVRRNYFLGIVKDFVIKGVEKQFSLKQQFQDEKEIIQASGELNFEQFEVGKEDYSAEDITYAFDFDVDNMAASNEAQFNNIVNLLTVTSNSPALQPILAKLDPFKTGKRLFKLGGLNYESLTSEEVEEVVHISPERENELALKGELMPRPKAGENYEHHMKVHKELIEERIKELGQSAVEDPAVNMLIEHIAETEMVAQKAKGTKPQAPAPDPMQDQQQSVQPQGPKGPLRGTPQ